jgi:hypothetical protein
VNVGLDFLPGSLPYTPAAGFQPSAAEAATVVWLDALISNVDRTPRNPNLLVWHERLWLIDHGAALFFHHRDWDPEVDAAKPFAGIADHVLLPIAGPMPDLDVPEDLVRAAVDAVPPEWADRDRYADYLTRRLARPRGWLP